MYWAREPNLHHSQAMPRPRRFQLTNALRPGVDSIHICGPNHCSERAKCHSERSIPMKVAGCVLGGVVREVRGGYMVVPRNAVYSAK